MFKNKAFDLRNLNSMEKVQIEIAALNKVTKTVLDFNKKFPPDRLLELHAYSKRICLLRTLIASKQVDPKI